MNSSFHKATLLALVVATGWNGRMGAQTPMPAVTNRWTAIFPGYQNTSSSTPAVAPDGTIFTGTWLGYFMAYTPEGATRWSFKAGREIKSSPAIADDGTVYFGSRDRKLYALTPAGKLKWAYATGAWVNSSPAIAVDGTVYFGGWDKYFYALNPDGSLKWKVAVGSIVDSSPAIATDGTVYFGAHDKKLYALRPDGSGRWNFPTGGVIVSSPAIGADGTIYFSSLDGNLYAVNPDGAERWHYHTGSITESSPVVAMSGDICIGVDNATVFVTAYGERYLFFGSPVPVDVSAVAAGDRFCYPAPWRSILAIKAGDTDWQRQLWQADLADNASTSLTVNPEGTIYTCAGFHLYAFCPPGELLPPAKGPWPMFRANPRHTGRAGN